METVVKEVRESVKAAIHESGYDFPDGLISPYLYSYPLGIDLDESSWSIACGASFEARRSNNNLSRFLSPNSLIELQQTLQLPDFEWQSKSLLHLIEKQTVPDFVHVYTHEPDNVSHSSWYQYEPELYWGKKSELKSEDKVTEMYQRIDAFVGKLVDGLPQNTVLVISPDHGQAATILSSRTSSVHRFGPPGVLFLYGGLLRQER